MEIPLNIVSDALMKPNAIRVENMNRIIKKRFNGSISDFVEVVWAGETEKTKQTKQNYISQIRGGAKPLSEANSALIEKMLNLPEGFMSRNHFVLEGNLNNINDFEAIELAITKIMNQFIKSGVYAQNKQMDTSYFAAFVVAEYKAILDKKLDDISKQKEASKVS
jgi:hypothetical protein